MSEILETYGNYKITYSVNENYATIKVVDVSTSRVLSIRGQQLGAGFDSTSLSDVVLTTLFSERSAIEDSLADIFANVKKQQDFLLNTPNLSNADKVAAEQIISQQGQLLEQQQTDLSNLNNIITSVNFNSGSIIRQLANDPTILPDFENPLQTNSASLPTQSTNSSTISSEAVISAGVTDLSKISVGSIDVSAVGLKDAPIIDSTGNVVGNIKGGQITYPPAAQAQWGPAKDLRAKLRVPSEYITPGTPAAGPSDIIYKNGGILFPYTPSISVDNKAEYTSQTPTHSNFAQYFYKNSSVGPISITAKFSVQNEFEGAVLLGTIHLLRSLIKMRFGDDPLAGSPPPVCRFDGYGDYMLYNVPVAITGWRHEITEGSDFITVGRPGSSTMYGHSMVPVLSSFTIEMSIMYSRREMLSHNVPDWLSGNLRYKGFL